MTAAAAGRFARLAKNSARLTGRIGNLSQVEPVE